MVIMAMNKKCPKCGSAHVQMSEEKSKHGCLFTILFGIYYIMLVMFKWMIGLLILICYDWWMAIIKAVRKKGFVWQSKKWFSGKKRTY
jgi:hypothetical protein